MDSERIVLSIPVTLTAEEFGKYCRIQPDSSAFDMLEEAMPLIQQWAAPKAIIKWASVDRINGSLCTIEGHTFDSTIVAEKLRGQQRVFLSVITAGEGLEKCDELEDDAFLDLYNGALLFYASEYVLRFMKEQFGFDGSSMLNPGSLPDWPIENNHSFFDIVGDVAEIGVTLNSAGYIKPWNSGSHLHFAGDGFKSCSLCKKYDCIGRQAPFDAKEYKRIFHSEP
ncbi:MAG: hypothetical protein MJ075_02055 [Oscillospiraceae bacterium]|nr:hypothetical protein [Oscillospiraceae bacterium]